MSRFLLATVALQAALGLALALPPDQVVVYDIKSDSSNPSSTTVIRLTLKLHAVQQVDDQIAWQVLECWVRHPTVGSPDEVWLESLPAVGTSDGLWWVQHANPAEPAVTDFTAVPLISGRGTRVGGQGDDLDYAFEGTSEPPPSPPALTEPYVGLSWFPFYRFRYWSHSHDFEKDEDGGWIFVPDPKINPIPG
jgi:hypothetical protein